MKKSYIWIACLLLTTFSCFKKELRPPKINVTAQWQIDTYGNPVSTANDNQWKSNSLTEEEMRLFNSLDTMNLAGTTTPVNMSEAVNYPFPNPFRDMHTLVFNFGGGFSGDVVFKYVIADRYLQAVDKRVARLNAQNANASVAIQPPVPVGQYRLYYTLSSQANPHFYKRWGNIQKVQ
jgi:hypothetical protein